MLFAIFFRWKAARAESLSLSCESRTRATLLLVLALCLSGDERQSSPSCWSASDIAADAGNAEIIRTSIATPLHVPWRGPALGARPSVHQRGAIRRVTLPPGRKLIALTFDLCESSSETAGYQGEIVEFLRSNFVRATFFAGGKWMQTHPTRVEQLMSDSRFEVANHGWAHRNLRSLDGQQLRDEIGHPQTIFGGIRQRLAARKCKAPDGFVSPQHTQRDLSLFRFPYGACDARSLEAVAVAGMTAIQWDISSGDPWPKQTADLIVERVLARARAGSIVIFHANGRGWHTAEALPKIVGELRRRGFEFVTVSDLIKAGEPEFGAVCYDQRPGDTDRYDAAPLR